MIFTFEDGFNLGLKSLPSIPVSASVPQAMKSFRQFFFHQFKFASTSKNSNRRKPFKSTTNVMVDIYCLGQIETFLRLYLQNSVWR